MAPGGLYRAISVEMDRPSCAAPSAMPALAAPTVDSEEAISSASGNFLFTPAASKSPDCESYTSTAYVTDPEKEPGLPVPLAAMFATNPPGAIRETVARPGTLDSTSTRIRRNRSVLGPGADVGLKVAVDDGCKPARHIVSEYPAVFR